jgi:hypothetical protein
MTKYNPGTIYDDYNDQEEMRKSAIQVSIAKMKKNS